MKSEKFGDLIPQELFNEIADYIKSIYNQSVNGSWRSSRSDEDALSGDFFGKLQKEMSVHSTGLSWDIDYRKTRGRGGKNPETITGADGIFMLEIRDENGVVIFQKAFLFQSKMKKSFSKSTTMQQAKNMNRIAKNGAVIIVFHENKYIAIKAEDYLNGKFKEYELDNYIIDIFFECIHGKFDMKYNIDDEELSVMNEEGSINKYSPKDFEEIITLTINE